ncbi:MAG: UDP-N-acetylmuramate dehydrogenase [Patescibacteria group bacterium]|nr:UDP-N-acetylmuramate dehydrogenase [Patescibacteria group bacterium]
MDLLYPELKKYGKTKTNVLLSRHTTFKIGGPAKYVVTVSEADKLPALLNFLSGAGEDFFILGGGSNVLAPDEGFSGVVIKIDCAKCRTDKDEIIIEAGALLSTAVNEAAARGLSGLEWATGIPGTVGGAVRGNAGAHGSDMAQNIKQVEAWRNGETTALTSAECAFGYRDSIFKRDGGVVLRATFKLIPSDQASVVKKMQEILLGRSQKLPTVPSAGSFFKNIKTGDWPGALPGNLPEIYRERGMIPAGWLVEQAGLKGVKIGGAQVSPQHGNFIINAGNATQADVVALVEEIKGRVYDKYRVWLEPEVEIIMP